MIRRRNLFFGLLASALLAVQIAAAAHEVEHALEQHDDPSCGLHLYFGNLDKSVIAPVVMTPVFTTGLQIPASTSSPTHTTPLLAYRGRAPPTAFPL